MGAVRVEIFRVHGRTNPFPGQKSQQTPLQTSVETTNNATATTAGSRITVAAAGGYRSLFARITTDTLGYAAIGPNPTADKTTAAAWRILPNEALEVPVIPGDKFSFIDN
jgi:hypothetical protein